MCRPLPLLSPSRGEKAGVLLNLSLDLHGFLNPVCHSDFLRVAQRHRIQIGDTYAVNRIILLTVYCPKPQNYGMCTHFPISVLVFILIYLAPVPIL